MCRDQPTTTALVDGRGGIVSGIAAGLRAHVFARERQQQIARIVEAHGRARVADLARAFGVSAVTIRKDIAVLESEQRVIRTHGGCIAPERGRPEPAFGIRERAQGDEKSAIGAAAAARVRDGESIALDTSTTALYVARHLMERRTWHGLTVLTSSLRIATELAGHGGITVLMPGGRVRWEALSLVGPLFAGSLRRVSVQTFFVGAAGFTIDAGLTEAREEEAQRKRAILAVARDVVAIVDHTKWGRVAAASICRTDRLTAVISDVGAPSAMVASLRDMGIEVTLAGAGPIAGPIPAARAMADETAAGDGAGARRLP
jgi:DeoR/GlpR family transcriptional regulator of sugar metabolism